jgi:predicted amino acid-binding ACT domain protein
MSQTQIEEIKILQQVISDLFEMYTTTKLSRADRQALDKRIAVKQKQLAQVIKR